MAIKSQVIQSGIKKSVISSQNAPIRFIFQKNPSLNTKNPSRNRTIKAKNQEITMPQIMASKKEFKTAVARNKARRRILEAYTAVMSEKINIHPYTEPQTGDKKGDKNEPLFKIHAKIGVLDSDFETLKRIIKDQIERI